MNESFSLTIFTMFSCFRICVYTIYREAKILQNRWTLRKVSGGGHFIIKHLCYKFSFILRLFWYYSTKIYQKTQCQCFPRNPQYCFPETRNQDKTLKTSRKQQNHLRNQEKTLNFTWASARLAILAELNAEWPDAPRVLAVAPKNQQTYKVDFCNWYII